MVLVLKAQSSERLPFKEAEPRGPELKAGEGGRAEARLGLRL